MLESIMIPCSTTHLTPLTTRGKFKSEREIYWFYNKTNQIKCCSSSRNNIKVKMVNYYEVLGIGEDSSVQEIKEAYRRLQKQHHPDIAGHQV
jgi:DnaJ domain